MTIIELKNIINKTYQINPLFENERMLEYKFITFYSDPPNDLWKVQRAESTDDYFISDDLKHGVSKEGPLAYWLEQ